jgi:acyl-CoA synthetase (AMP-forming)/AMP-acid ligase II/lauroyl/myristoyl acyltransferase/acyl carrier protein
MSLPFATLVDLLHERAQRQPDQMAYTFLADGLADGEDVSLTLSYAELDTQARAIAAHLQQRTNRGDRALLAYPSGLPFLAAFFGCLYADVIPVPTSIPYHQRPDIRFQSIVADAKPVSVLTETSILPLIQTQIQGAATTTPPWCLSTDTICCDRAAAWRPPDIRGETLALLQYTSGSTGSPKGVMVTHHNVLYNQEMLRHAFQTSPASVAVEWLPHFHDMGLIAHLLHALYVGFPCIFMSPMAFAQRPARWLRALSRYGGTVAGAPNFAFELCATRAFPKLLAELDLSSWEVAFNGAEPIRADTLERFAQTFANCGFRAATCHPVYGLAEASVFVTGGRVQQKPVQMDVDASALEQHRVVMSAPAPGPVHTLVSSGRSWLAQQIAIVNPETLVRCGAAEVGEIWVAGPHVAVGYWQKPEATGETFGASIRGEASSAGAPFLRTGDLGFMHEGELFVTGRLKDLIIIRGRNYYPQDIEWVVANRHPRLRPNGVAAFALDVDSEERLVVVQEVTAAFNVDREAASFIRDTQQELGEQLQLRAWAIVLVPPKTIPKTSSGKVQRQACRQLFRDQALPQVLTYYDAEPDSEAALDLHPPDDRSPQSLESWLSRLLAEVLELEHVDPHASFFALNIDSLQLVHLLVQVEHALDQPIPVQRLVQQPTIAHLAQLVSEPRSRAAPLSTSGAQTPLPPAPQPAFRRRVHRRLLHVGPSWRSIGLPYAVGSRLLRGFVQQTWVQNSVYSGQINLLKRCMATVPQERAVDTVVEQSLLINSWPLWRAQMLSHPDQFEQWVTIGNLTFLEESLRDGQGVVLALCHTPLKRLLWHVPILQRQELAVIGNMGAASLRRIGLTEMAEAMPLSPGPAKAASRLTQLYHAQEVLKRGGVAVMFPEDTDGEGGITVPFHGRYRPFRPGMAELAVRTHARLVPAFAHLHPSGRVTFELLAPLEAEQGVAATRIEALLHQYAEISSARWGTDLGHFEWYILNKYLQLPQVDPQASS